MADYVRVGDWAVPREAYERAKEEMASWPDDRRARDRLFRAPIETDVEEWAEDPRGVDFPGVDTPTREPRTSVLDASRAARRGPGDAVHDPEPAEPVAGSRLLGGVKRGGGVVPDDEALEGVRDAFRL